MPRKPIEKAAESGEWIGLAWAAWCAGERNLAALGKQFNKAPATVKANLIKYSAARAAETQSVDATAEYIDGLEHDMREALRTYRTAENPNAKVGALKHATSCREKLAAAKGVVTERKSVAVGQDPDLGPAGGDALEQLSGAIARLAARAGEGEDTCDADPAAGE